MEVFWFSVHLTGFGSASVYYLAIILLPKYIGHVKSTIYTIYLVETREIILFSYKAPVCVAATQRIVGTGENCDQIDTPSSCLRAC